MILHTGGFKTRLKMFGVFLLLTLPICFAQSTTVTGPVIDPSGNTWSSATVQAIFVPAPNVPGPYVWSGGAFNTLPPKVTTDAGGNFSITLPSNTSITPSGSSWQIITGPNATTSAALANVMLSGGTLNISTAYNAAAGWPTARINPTPVTTVYNTNQTLPPPTGQGGMVYNTTNQTMEVFTVTGWQPFAIVGGVPVVINPAGNQNIIQPGGSFLQVNGNNVLDTSTGVQLNPAATQTVNQPVGTTLQATSLNSVLNATLFAGVDIGAKINTAIAALPASGGKIIIPTGTYSYTTPIVISKPNVSLLGDNTSSTVLDFTSTSGTAMLVSGSLASLSNFSLKGQAAATTAVGLNISGPGVIVTGLVIGGASTTKFHIGLTFGNNAFNDNFYNLQVLVNDQNLLYPAGLSNSGENISFVGSSFAGSVTFANCVQIGTQFVPVGAELSFVNTSFDECQVVNNEGIFKMFGGHLEDGGVAADHPFIKTWSSDLDSITGDQGTFLYNPTLVMDVTPTGSGLFEVDNRGVLSIYGLTVGNSVPIPIVQIGSGAVQSPTLNYIDSSYQLTEAQLYSIFPGALPVLNISTGSVNEHTTFATNVFANNQPGLLYGANQAIITKGSILGSYQWTGVGTSWSGQQLRGFNGAGFQVCSGGTFAFTNYAALGTESENCGTTLTDVQVHSANLAAGAGINITNTSLVPQVGTPTVGQAACIKAAGPPVIIGYCSTVVSAGGACTCN